MLKLILIALYFTARSADAGDDAKKLDAKFESAPSNVTDADPKGLAAASPFILRDASYAVGGYAKVNWFQAQLTCASEGLTLISFQTETDLKNAVNWIRNNAYFLSNERLWTSGTNLANQGVWSWFSNGRPLSYRNWFPNEPDNEESGEQCLEFDSASGQWNDMTCGAANYFICEPRCPASD